MKKRLLALALCLVMASSLLPISAAAEDTSPVYHVNSVEIEADGVYLGTDGYYHLNITYWKIVCDEGTIDINDENTKTSSDFSNVNGSLPDNPSEEGAKYLAVCTIGFNSLDLGTFSWNYNEIPSCTLRIPGYASVFDESVPPMTGRNVILPAFILTKEHEHDWRFTQTDSTLTGTCRKSTCPIKTVDVNLAADSVTLPNSPFNARLEGQSQFETATGAAISKIRYDYKGSDGVWHKGVDPVSANAKAGEYQAFVQISNLPRPVESDGVVAMAENPDGIYTADLFVKYTAVDPAITAQTGDNRPIELMMGSVVLFSALAAAAFVADSKRRSRQ